MFRAIVAFLGIWERHEAVLRFVSQTEPMSRDDRKWVAKVQNETLGKSLDQQNGHAVVDIAEPPNLEQVCEGLWENRS